MPTVITCPKCGGNGTVTLGMTWEEAVNLAECAMRNEQFTLYGIQSKTNSCGSYFVVVVMEKKYSNTIYEITSYKHFLQIAEDLRKNEKETK